MQNNWVSRYFFAHLGARVQPSAPEPATAPTFPETQRVNISFAVSPQRHVIEVDADEGEWRLAVGAFGHVGLKGRCGEPPQVSVGDGPRWPGTRPLNRKRLDGEGLREGVL